MVPTITTPPHSKNACYSTPSPEGDVKGVPWGRFTGDGLAQIFEEESGRAGLALPEGLYAPCPVSPGRIRTDVARTRASQD